MRNTSHWNPKDALPPGVVRHRHQVTSKDGDTRLDAASPALDKATSALVLVSRLRLPGRCLGYAGLSALLAACSPSPHLYVAPDGADANSGTKASPFLTIARADAAAAPGYTIHVAPGAYPVSAPTLHSAGIVTSRSGTAAARIRFVSDIKWAAKILVSGTGIAWRSKGNYVDIDGFDNFVSGVAAAGIQQWHGATASTIVNNTVFRCKVGILIGGGDAGTLPEGSQNNLVSNNIVYDNITYGIVEGGKVGANNRYVDNLVHASGTALRVSGQVSGTILADPQFRDYQADGMGDYRVKHSSPAVRLQQSRAGPAAPVHCAEGAPRQVGAYQIGSVEQ